MPVNPFSSELDAVYFGERAGALRGPRLVRTPQVNYPPELLLPDKEHPFAQIGRVGEASGLFVHITLPNPKRVEFGLRAIALAGSRPGRERRGKPQLFIGPVHRRNGNSGELCFLADSPREEDGRHLPELRLNLPLGNWPEAALNNEVMEEAFQRSILASRGALPFSPYNPRSDWENLTFNPWLPPRVRRVLEEALEDPDKWVKPPTAARLGVPSPQ